MQNESFKAYAKQEAPQGMPALQVDSEIIRLDSIAKNADSTIGTLEARLSRVMQRTGNNKSDGSGSPPQPVRCDLAQRLHELGDTYNSLAERLDVILSSLEV